LILGKGLRDDTSSTTSTSSAGGRCDEKSIPPGGRGSSSSIDDEDKGDGIPASSEYDEEHPMRTDEWILDVRLSRLYNVEGDVYFPECNDDGAFAVDAATSTSGRATMSIGHHPLPPRRNANVNKGKYRKLQVMQFARNGYVRVVDDASGGGGGGGRGRRKNRVGKWRIGHSGVAFDIPVHVTSVGSTTRRGGRGGGGGGGEGGRRGGNGNDDDDDDGPIIRRRTTVLHYHAEIHLNKFGERPRMFRGVITRDR
jgi:hypothetical protein